MDLPQAGFDQHTNRRISYNTNGPVQRKPSLYQSELPGLNCSVGCAYIRNRELTSVYGLPSTGRPYGIGDGRGSCVCEASEEYTDAEAEEHE
jgi:hypothetical protein